MLTKQDILDYLETDDSEAIQSLIRQADRVRRQYVGDTVHLRAILEISNICRRNCLYCGLRCGRSELPRYRISQDDILQQAEHIAALGFRTLVLQSGEDPYFSAEMLAQLIKTIKRRLGLTITLSVGERPRRDYEMWFDAGAERYLLKHETSDPELYARLHPGMTLDERLRCLETLKTIGFQTGSGIMIGLPGQSLNSLADDILLFREMDIDMMGIGPYIPNPATPAPALFEKYPFPHDAEELTYRVVALTRVVTRDTLIPTTTALSTLNPDMGRALGLICGANVIMPDATPPAFRKMYEIYPKKLGAELSLEEQLHGIQELVESLGRQIARDAGHRVRREQAVG